MNIERLHYYYLSEISIPPDPTGSSKTFKNEVSLLLDLPYSLLLSFRSLFTIPTVTVMPSRLAGSRREEETCGIRDRGMFVHLVGTVACCRYHLVDLLL